MVYRALTEYLLHHGPKPVVRWGLVVLAVGMIGLSALLAPYPAAVVFVSIFAIWSMVALNVWLNNRERAASAQMGRLDANDWLATLARFARDKQLESRSHPELIEVFESCARLRQAILDELRSEKWNALSLKHGWADVRKQCEASAQRLFDEALWASKAAIRPIGARRETFSRKCQDPAFAASALAAVRLVCTQLERLYEEVHDDPFAAQGVRDALVRAQTELQAIRAAERELGPMDRFLESP